MAIDTLSLDFGRDKPFYVYLYRDPRPRRGKRPIYVGKGTASQARADIHWRHGTHNPILKRLFAKFRRANLEPIIEVIAWFDREDEAFALERALIEKFGRRDKNTGPLANMTSGGEGASNPSPETRARLSAATKANWQDVDFRIAQANAKSTEKYKMVMGDVMRSRWAEREYRQKRSVDTAALVNGAEFKAKRSATLKRTMADPEVREKISNRVSEHHKNPEYRSAASVAATECWLNPVFRETTLAARMSPKVREKVTALARSGYPARRAAMISANKLAWADPIKRAARIAAMQAGRARQREILNDVDHYRSVSQGSEGG